jgi:hypothetical protein
MATAISQSGAVKCSTLASRHRGFLVVSREVGVARGDRGVGTCSATASGSYCL